MGATSRGMVEEGTCNDKKAARGVCLHGEEEEDVQRTGTFCVQNERQ